LQLINDLENGRLDPNHGLKKVISLLITRSDQFTLLCGKTIEQCGKYLAFSPPRQNIQALLLRHVNESQYPARLFEIAMHSLLQVLVEDESLGGFLRSLSQMRAANKKAGNIGDLEILALSDPNSEILEAWDAKYGKPYLYDELDELVDKLPTHKSIRRAGFVTNSKPDIRKEVIEKIDEIEDSLNIRIEILPFNEWIEEQLKRSNKGSDILIKEWLKAYIESICMMRREVAPIDEPTEGWVKEMSLLLQRSINEMRNRV
jgi:hypothetical protein